MTTAVSLNHKRSIWHLTVELRNERKVQLNSPVTESERTQLRALLGGLQWLVTQTRVDGMIDVNLLQSCVATATVETLLSANKIVRKLRQGPAELYTRRLPDHEKHHLVAWSDVGLGEQKRREIHWWISHRSLR